MRCISIPLSFWMPLLAVAVLAAFPAHAQTSNPLNLTVQNLTLTGSQRVGLTRFQYTYQVTVGNAGATSARNVTATVTSLSPATQITQGSLAFLDIAAGASAPSTNTFSIVQDRTVPFDRSQLSFAFQYQVAPAFVLSLGGQSQAGGGALLSVPRGAFATLGLTVVRDPNFSGNIQVTLENAPNGVISSPLTLTSAANSSKLQLFADPTRLAAGTLPPFNVLAVGGGIQQELPLTLNVVPLVTSQQKISDALAAGTIDLGTSLLYRAYAITGDVQLPANFAGTGSMPEDRTLRREIDQNQTTLSASVLALLQPYLVRPTDSQSFWNQTSRAAANAAARIRMTAATRGTSVNSRMARSSAAASGTPVTLVESATCPAQRSDSTWIYQRANYPSQGNFILWAQCEATAPVGRIDRAERALSVAKFDLDAVWPSIADLMGPPLQDAGSGGTDIDTSIDIYIVPTTAQVERGLAEPDSIDNDDRGETVAVDVDEAPRSSAYLLINDAPLNGDDLGAFHSTLFHELYHLTQDAHNYSGLYQLAETGVRPPDHWFIEASATWAQVYFELLLDLPPRYNFTKYLERFAGDFQGRTVPLNAPGPGLHTYGAFIWPFYVEQTQGAAKIAQMWQALETVQPGDWNLNTPTLVDDLLNGVVPFSDNYADFALVNLNGPFQPGDPLPFAMRYVHTDPDPDPDTGLPMFPDGHPPQITHAFQITPSGAGPFSDSIAVDIDNLSTAYYTIEVKGSAVGRVSVDWSSLAPTGNLNVDAVAFTVDDNWGLRRLHDKQHETFCSRNTSPDTTFFIWIIVSNSDRTPGNRITGTLNIEYGGTNAQYADCGCHPRASGLYCPNQVTGGTSTFLYGLNDSAVLAGSAFLSDGLHPSAWPSVSQPFGLVSPVDTRRGWAFSINNTGQAAGLISPPGQLANVVYWPSFMTPAPVTLDQSGPSGAFASFNTSPRSLISQDGTVAFVNSSNRLMRWNNGLAKDLGSAIEVHGLNNFGHLLARDTSGNWSLWKADAPFQTLPLDNAWSLNDLDWVAGSVLLGNSGQFAPTVWKPTIGRVFLNLPQTPVTIQLITGQAYDVNSRGDAVGFMDLDGFYPLGCGERAMLWKSDGTAIDLNDVIPSASGIQLQRAIAINSNGSIVVQGVFDPNRIGQPQSSCGSTNSAGGIDAFLLTPQSPQ